MLFDQDRQDRAAQAHDAHQVGRESTRPVLIVDAQKALARLKDACVVDQDSNASVGRERLCVSFMVHLGVFGNGKSTDPHFAWHEMIERYIEGSGIAWCHVHPHFFMENLLTRYPLLNERMVWFMGEKRVGWIANDDLAGVVAKVLAEGPARHASQNYWLSTEAMNGVETARALTQGLSRDIACDVKTPDDLIALLASHSFEPPAASATEATYAASTLEWMHQTYDGRMDYSAVATTTVADLLGRPPLGLRAWAELHRDAVLAASVATV